MKLENILKRVDLSRLSKVPHMLPYDNFLERIVSAIELVKFTDREKASKGIKLEARKNCIVACASAMETYFKRTARVFIDADLIKDDFLTMLKKDKISLADLLEINKRKLSIGEIISVSHSFQDLETINRIYNSMLGVMDFMREVEGFESEVAGNPVILKNDYPSFRVEIEKLLTLRHQIIHHEGFKGVLGIERLRNMAVNLIMFVSVADDYLQYKMPEEYIVQVLRRS